MGDGLVDVEGAGPVRDEGPETPPSGMELNNTEVSSAEGAPAQGVTAEAEGVPAEGVPPSGGVMTSLDVDNFDFSVGSKSDGSPPLYRFHEYKDLKRFAKMWARAHEYKLVTGSSKTGKNGYLKCSLAGEDRNKPDTNRQRLSRNKRIGCRFRISAHKPTSKDRPNEPWEIRIAEDLSHNHGPMETQYEVLNQQVDPALETEALRMASLGMKPRAVAMMLSQRSGCHVTCRTVYNATAAEKRGKRKGETPMQYLLRCLSESNWIHDEAYDENGQPLYVWFAHPGSLSVRNQQDVLDWFLLHEARVRGSIFMGVEEVEKALRNAIAVHFPDAVNNVCLWHIDQNICAACYPAFAADPAKYEVFKKKWNSVMYSKDEDAYDDAWGKLQMYLADRASVLDYLIKNIILDRELFMRPWIGQTAHLGNHTTARGESAHSWLKKHVTSHKTDFATVFEKIAQTVDYQVTSVVTQISNEKQKGKSGLPETFRPLNTKVSIHAIVMLEWQRDLYLKNRDSAAKGVDLDECTGSLWATMGIPCWHMLADILEDSGVVETTNIHDQWKLYYTPDDPNAEPPYDFHEDYAAMKEEILADVRPQDLPGLMAKLRQVQTNTVVVPLGEAPIIRNNRKGAKKKRKRGYVRAAERDAIHAEVVEAQVNEAQAKKKAARAKKVKIKGKPKATTKSNTLSSDATSCDEIGDEPDQLTKKRKLPLRSTQARKKVNLAESSDSGDSSSSADDSENADKESSGGSDGECTSRPLTAAGSPDVHGCSRAGTPTDSPPAGGVPDTPEDAELPSGLEEVLAELAKSEHVNAPKHFDTVADTQPNPEEQPIPSPSSPQVGPGHDSVMAPPAAPVAQARRPPAPITRGHGPQFRTWPEEGTCLGEETTNACKAIPTKPKRIRPKKIWLPPPTGVTPENGGDNGTAANGETGTPNDVGPQAAQGIVTDHGPPPQAPLVTAPKAMEAAHNELPAWVQKHVQSVYDPPGDGNCGYSCVARHMALEKPESLYAKTNGWYQVRQDLINELDNNKAHWTRRFGSNDEYKSVEIQIHCVNLCHHTS
ncbi:uncharacterized protein PGTG_21436 [Puccinia graminis f. sp. tritici CRL 75-36-700-3]|uniref:MULE transposase domain-containing protein n=1 Tax=Puccinia graminis f. sp. tritici (strain CRL 75-36-700-3 / race SCCL) TaxID=418459 RepID=H6QRB5_PUCGT|nr:uncharacterized protein PGTG_21436 [Puccinia graminis f. sp. tritici CRL 75-36-700-3]EHS63106.1 hypothetical protein PGTG_21436 [Puccinia graminis f. sp. tritici CRL 75-36-700-3]